MCNVIYRHFKSNEDLEHFKIIIIYNWGAPRKLNLVVLGPKYPKYGILTRTKEMFFFPGGIINHHCPWALWVVGLGFCPSRRLYLVLVDPICPLIFSTIQVWLSQPCIFELHVAFFFPEYMPPAGTLALPVLLPHWQRPRRCRGAEQRCETRRPPQASCPRRIQHSWLVLPNQDPG